MGKKRQKKAKVGKTRQKAGPIKKAAKRTKKEKPPKVFLEFVRRYPALGDAHQSVAKAVDDIGPLDEKACSLIKIGISVGAGLESAVRSHVRRARANGATKDEIEQAILLAFNTLGLPRTVAAWSWAQVQFERDK